MYGGYCAIQPNFGAGSVEYLNLGKLFWQTGGADL